MRKLVPFIIGGIIIVGGATAFFMANSDEPAKSSGSSSQSRNGFNAVTNSGESFRITISTEGRDGGQNNRAVVEVDAKTKAARYKANTEGGDVSIIYTEFAYYMCQADDCITYSLGEGTGANFNLKDYQYDESKLEDFNKNAVKQGRESCPAGTCDVWITKSDRAETKIYIDTKTKRISQVTQTSDGVTSKASYEYVDVNVEIPITDHESPTSVTGQ